MSFHGRSTWLFIETFRSAFVLFFILASDTHIEHTRHVFCVPSPVFTPCDPPKMSTTLDANSKDLAQAPDDTELLKDTERSSSKVDPQPTPQHGAVGGATPGTKDDSISAASDNVDQGSDPRPADGEGREKEAGKNKGGPPPFFEASVRSDATSFLFLLVVGLVIYAWRLHKKVKRMRLEGTLVATLKEELRELKQTIEFVRADLSRGGPRLNLGRRLLTPRRCLAVGQDVEGNHQVRPRRHQDISQSKRRLTAASLPG